MIHDIAHLLGLDNASGHWYLFWSGFAGDIPLFGGFGVLIFKHICHEPTCHKLTKHTYNGTPYCPKHHPLIGEK